MLLEPRPLPVQLVLARLCNCGKSINYKSNWALNKAILNNSVCPSCRTIANNKSTNRNSKGNNNPSWKGTEDVPMKVFKRLLRGAIKRGLDFDISINDIQTIYTNQGKICKLSGIPLSWNVDASVDRIDSKVGYLPWNIQIVHKHLNMMKKDLPDKTFINWCTLVANHSKCSI